MGYKGAVVTGCLGCVVLILQIMGSAVFPLHKTYVSFMTFTQLFRFDLYIIWWKVDPSSSDWCKLHEVFQNAEGQSWFVKASEAFAKDNPDESITFCDWLFQGGDLQDASQRICGAALQMFVPALCNGLSNAFPAGFALLVTMCGNLLCMLAAVALLFNYAHSERPKKRYRMNAGLILAVSAVCVMGAVAGEFVMVLRTLEQSGSNGFDAIVSANAGGQQGTSIGFYLVCVSPIIQLGMVVLCNTYVKSRREVDDNAIANEKEWLKHKNSVLQGQGIAGIGGYYGTPDIAPPASYYGYGQAELGLPPQGYEGMPVPNYGEQAYASPLAPYGPDYGMPGPPSDNYGGPAYVSYQQAPNPGANMYPQAPAAPAFAGMHPPPGAQALPPAW